MARHARDYGSLEADANYFHCISRFLDRKFLLDSDDEKEQFREWMFLYEKCYSVSIVSYAIMSNHVHILVRIPNGKDDLRAMSDEELLERIAPLYSEVGLKGIRFELEMAREQGYADEYRERYIRRMRNLSSFMGELKSRFSRYYNKKEGRKGPVWEERFKSVLVEDDPDVLQKMAVYIDLNPVRAGIVDDPAEYRWCSYAEAVAGSERAQLGLLRVFLETTGEPGAEALENWKGVFREMYRQMLFAEGRGLRC